jgi:hypothetical protein
MEDEGRHQLVEVVFGIIHLVALPDYATEYIEYLLCDEVIM